MHRVFCILSSKLDRKLNHPRRARTTLRSKVNIYGTIIRKVYREYTITSFLGNFGTCANIRYQAVFLPPPSRHGYEASTDCAYRKIHNNASKINAHIYTTRNAHVQCTCMYMYMYMYIVCTENTQSPCPSYSITLT